MQGPVRRAAAGAAAGALATLPMSVVMLVAGRAGWMGGQPPEKIAAAALEQAGLAPSEPAEDAAASVAHIGFGAAAGLAYALLPVTRLPLPAPVAGSLYGLGVWTASYAGWVPALGIMPPPNRDRRGRVATMVAAHLVYGSVLGWLVERAGRSSG